MKSARILVVICILLSVSTLVGGCAQMEQSASKAFDNANSVLRSPSDVMWSNTNPQPVNPSAINPPPVKDESGATVVTEQSATEGAKSDEKDAPKKSDRY